MNNTVNVTKRLPVIEGITAWRHAAEVAGANVPVHIELCLRDLFVANPAVHGVHPVDMRDIAHAVAEASRLCQEEHVEACDGTYHPCPRGFSMVFCPSGDCALLWSSDSHEIILRFCAEIAFRGPIVGGFRENDSGIVSEVLIDIDCRCGRGNDCPRIRAAGIHSGSRN